MIAMLRSSASSRSTCTGSALIKILQQAFQVSDVFDGEFSVASVVRDERRQFSIEEPVDDAFAFPGKPLLALHGRPVEIPAAALAGAQRAFRRQPAEQGF